MNAQDNRLEQLVVPLSGKQIIVANHLYQQLDQWRLSDTALRRLQQNIPGFDPEACLLKAVAVNQLYATNVLAIIPMARHVRRVLLDLDLASEGIGLVEKIAAFTHNGVETMRTSFAAKFCHFFINEQRFPIYDEAARLAMKLHLGPRYVNDTRYGTFCANLTELRTAAGLQENTRAIDRYLWMVGSYLRWKRNPKVNAEIRRVFEQPTPEETRKLEELLPACLRT
jgi:hypothetical protein